jgi:very-short-patch-repair endonuclease
LDRTERHGIPVTTIVRTLVDLAAVTPIARLEAALDDTLRRELTDVASVQTRLEQLAARSRRGVRNLRALLAERDPSTSASESVLETRFMRVLRDRGLPTPVPQFVIRTTAGRFIARVDFAYPDAGLVIEVDSYLHHGGRRKFEDDLRRRTELVAAGWQVVHVTARQIQRGAPEICALIARTVRRPA